MIVYEGPVITCDSAGTVARFLVEDGGKIAFVGDLLPARYAGVRRVILGSQALVPAFGDTHIHFMSYAVFSRGLDVRAATTIGHACDMIADFVRKKDSPSLVLGFGACANSVDERRLITRADIDRACSDRPVLIVKYDGHAGIANSALVALVQGRFGSLRGFCADSGIMTQEAFYRVVNFASAKVSLLTTLGSMLSAIDRLAGYGIGLVHSVTGVGFPADLDVALESIFARGLRNPIQYRVFFQTMEVRKVLRRRLPRIGGCFATALDGCFGSVDAALLEPYEQTAGLTPQYGNGVLYYSDERVKAFCKEANRAGLQIEMHAIGDAAFEQATSAIAAALADFPRHDHRHTIIHACLPTTRGLEACARLGIHLAVQPAFHRWKQEPVEYTASILGRRAYDISPLRTMTDMGIVLAGGSDAPCTIPDPIEGIWAACNHYVSGQSLTVQEALNLYTLNAARLSFDEKDRGSLEAGKVADMVVLSANPLATPPAQLRELTVQRLLIAGKPYRSGQGTLSVLLNGLVNRSRRI